MKDTVRIISLMLALLMVVGLCACKADTDRQTGTAGEPANSAASDNGKTDDASQPAANAAPVSTRKLKARIKTEPDTLDPHKTAGTGDPQMVQYQIYESLFREEKDGSVVEGLAESYEFADDKTAITVKIRENVHFQNGDLMTVDDVVFSLNRSMETGFNGIYIGAIDSVEKVDEAHVKVNLKYAYSPILSCLSTLSTAIVSKAYVEAGGEDVLSRKPMGTGAYILENWVSGESLDFVAFADYWRGAPAIQEASFIIIADNATAFIALETGEVDICCHNLNLADLPAIREHKYLKYYTCPNASLAIFAMNNKDGVFSDVRMREAVYLTIDREAILQSVRQGEGSLATACMMKMLDEYPENFEVPARDIERAKQLVAEAGYPNGVTVYAPTIDNQTYIKPIVVLQEQLAEVGITIDIQPMDRAAWNEAVITNTDYEIASWGLPVTALDADYLASKFYSANMNGGGNFSNSNVAEIDKWIEQGRLLEPGEERNEAYRKFCEAIRDNYVVLPYFTTFRDVCATPDLQGVAASSTTHYFFYDWSWAQ